MTIHLGTQDDILLLHSRIRNIPLTCNAACNICDQFSIDLDLDQMFHPRKDVPLGTRFHLNYNQELYIHCSLVFQTTLQVFDQ